MKHLQEDTGFQEGYELAQYLERTPCPHRNDGTHCKDCIATAVSFVDNIKPVDDFYKRSPRPRIKQRRRTF